MTVKAAIEKREKEDNCHQITDLKIITKRNMDFKKNSSILAVPKWIRNTILCLEIYLVSVEARAWLLLVNFWLELIFFPISLAPFAFRDCFKSMWLKQATDKIHLLSFSMQSLCSLGFKNARCALKPQILLLRVIYC